MKSVGWSGTSETTKFGEFFLQSDCHTDEIQRPALLPVIVATFLSRGPVQTAGITQTGQESLQRLRSPCRWGEERPTGS